MLGTRHVNTARMRDDPTSVIGRYDILPMLPIAVFVRVIAMNIYQQETDQ